MHGLLVRVDVKGEMSHLKKMLVEYGNVLNERDGFIMKTWVMSDQMVGGFYIFTDEGSAQSYIDEMLNPTAVQYGVFSVEHIEHFEILGDLSALTNSPVDVSSVRLGVAQRT